MKASPTTRELISGPKVGVAQASVTLRQHDTYNLTTGQVRRVADAKGLGAYLPGHVEGLKANDLITLASAIRINHLCPVQFERTLRQH